MHCCPRCGWVLVYRVTVWGCLRPNCTYETPATPADLEALVADITRSRRRRPPIPAQKEARSMTANYAPTHIAPPAREGR